MKLCLVAPPTIELFEEGALARSESSKEVAEDLPLGVLTLAAIAERMGVPTQLVDLNQIHFRRSWPDAFHYRRSDYCSLAVEELARLEFDVLGLSTMCGTYPLSLRIAREIKRLRPETLIVLGGPQASVVDEATLAAFPFVDVIVRGEAEESFPQLLHALQRGSALHLISGLTFRDRGRVVRTANSAVIQDLDALPLPAFHLYSRMKECRYIPIEIGRGCPFGCTFCSTNDFFRRRFRLKSPATVIEQMCQLEETYGVSSFELVHDMFTVDRRRVVAFCEALIGAGKKFGWSCSARTDSVDEELLALMAAAGCQGMFFGIEVGSARMQKIIRKNLDMAEAERLLEFSGKAGIGITVAFIDGFPEEQREDLAATADFILNAARFDHVSPQINILAPLAKTPLLEQYRDRLVLDDVFSDMSHQGWRQDPADRELIAAYPEIFPNFYGVPCALGRAYVNEFNKFLTNGLARFRWLLVALHQQRGNLLPVFDAWLAWRGASEDPSRYYCTVEFSRDFKSFLRTGYLRQGGDAGLGVEGILGYYEALDEALSAEEARVGAEAAAPGALSQSAIPRLAEGARILRLDLDVKSIIEHLRRREPIGREVLSDTVLAARDTRAGQVELYKMPSLSALLLNLCDGDRDVTGIVRQFSLQAGMEEPELAEAACLEGLALLNRHSLIQFQSAG